MSKKISIILTRTLGDVMLIHNLVDGVYKKYPCALEIDVYVDEMYKDIVQGNEKINKIFTSPRWLSNWKYILQMVAGDDYNEVLIPQQVTTEDALWHQMDYLRHQHLVDYYLERCRLPKRDLGDAVQLYVSNEDIDKVDQLLIEKNITNYIVIHSTSGVPTKDWNYFSELVSILTEKEITIVQVGAVTDKLVSCSSNDYFCDERGKLTFSQIGALCKKADCFVGLDSGISYISASAKIPTIVLQGSTIPETSGPWGDNVINVLSKTLPSCESLRCHANCRYISEVPGGKCINLIKVNDVLNVVKEFTYDKKEKI